MMTDEMDEQEERRVGGQPGVPRAHCLLPYLQAWRTSRGLSRRELAKQSTVAEGTIYAAEHGAAVKLSTVERLAAFFDITADRLMGKPPTRGRK